MPSPTRSDDQKTQPKQSTEFSAVLRAHLAMFSEHYRQPITELSVLAYAKDLADLTPSQLDAACTHARKTSEFMPVSATIRHSHEILQESPEIFLGPPMENYTDTATQEERDEAIAEYDAKLKEVLEKQTTKPTTVLNFKAEITVSLGEAYREYLNEQNRYDKMLEATGRAPLPRSPEERQAMFAALSPQERNYYRRKAEWIKLHTETTLRRTAGR